VLVRAAVGVHERTAVALEHEQAGGDGGMRVEAAGVIDAAAAAGGRGA